VSAVLVEQRAGIAVVTLNRPHALNAVDDALRAALIAALADANRDAAVRAVVITGAGDRAFCAGQDLEDPRRGRQVGQGRAGRKHQGGLTPSSGAPASACRGRRRQYVMELSRTPRAAEGTRA